MLLTITNTKAPATDLGYLLHKNPSRAQSFELSFGKAHVFYPEATANRCTAALLLDVDPVGLVRTRRGPAGEGGMLDQYVNDRPYVASSFMSVAIARIFNSALSGTSKGRPELVNAPLPLSARVTLLPCRGGEAFLRRLFEPLGYQITAEHHPLDEKFPEWGESSYYTVEIAKRVRLQDLLTHLYVLIPVLDADKHYWIGKDEVEKLLRHGEGWLQAHPEREAIISRYLRGFHKLTREALARLMEDESLDPDAEQETKEEQEQAGRERQHPPSVQHGEHLPVAVQVAHREAVQLARREFLLHGVDGEDGHPDAPQDRVLDGLVAAEFQGDPEVGRGPARLLQ